MPFFIESRLHLRLQIGSQSLWNGNNERLLGNPGTLHVLASRLRSGALPPLFADYQQRRGPKRQPKKDAARDTAIELRKKNHSVYDIHRILRENGLILSVRAIWEILKDVGFARLPRRLDEERPAWPVAIAAAYADRRQFTLSPKEFKTQAGGLFLFLPFLIDLKIDQIIEKAGYPSTQAIPALQYFLSLLSLKLLSRERISHVMDWVHDPGAALWCGLNVLPKTTALTTYSYRLSRSQNLLFLKFWNQALLSPLRKSRLSKRPITCEAEVGSICSPHCGQ